LVRGAVHDTLPGHARLWFEGAARQQIEASQSILFAFGMALLIAFLVLSAQFENFRLPAIILITAPMALLGGMLATILIFSGHFAFFTYLRPFLETVAQASVEGVS
ncbi:efflux RND transporter permease subunit, partial [Escherichia coli]|nr:efflux RND transporter permease subunit [Escherichia coli]